MEARAVVFRRSARKWKEALSKRMGTPHVFQFREGCACVFLSDDGDDNRADGDRESATAALDRFVEAGLADGSVTLLICWGGDELKQGQAQRTARRDLAELDFDSAWDRPLIVAVD